MIAVNSGLGFLIIDARNAGNRYDLVVAGMVLIGVIGIALDSTYSYLAGFLPEAEWRRIMNLLVAIGAPIYAPELGEGVEPAGQAHLVLQGLADFQEHLGGRLTIMLLEGIGKPFDVNDVRPNLMLKSIETLKRLEAERTIASAKKAS